ncbi:MAG: cupin domain-containing protein [Cyanobacteria bacterium]|nr:cupin domain-containing protein [Cyanobacteria bacterium CG_2015-16_32_12]NCO78907.1 cupin domain-containing protein [Cyanobacteria bacterium CG_2015-22_32_23]NCQ04984.1 cupin domain-containing protein [Cyanobacteria bacterium CG_2015-09_32_10]NCQ42970.1 cupin domain-containing protein [Cyanobacteria bacterium CG_2015-04_32_10]NCS84229.1 cupin domain-containing protein [Cyanobacteria bacterium CG_2015-02_32_10]
MNNNFKNIFTEIFSLEKGEDFKEILRCKNVVIERIISSDQPDNIIYNQIQDEWVILLQGNATLQVAEKIYDLTSGDYLFISANTPHQVIKTSKDPFCIWLAIHIYD